MTPRRAASLMLGALLVVFGARAALPEGLYDRQPKFAEVKWPFAMDQWGLGHAWRCGAEDCGVEVNVFLRAKIGFCNCTTGVSDDAELDRVGDVSLIGDNFTAQNPGEPVRVGWMNGRKRVFDVAAPFAAHRGAMAIAVNHKCDVIVATVTSGRDVPLEAQRAALAFLNTAPVLTWAMGELGL